MPVGRGCCLFHLQPAMCRQISLQESHVKQHFFLQRRSLHKHRVAAAIHGAHRAAVSSRGSWNLSLCYVIGSGRKVLSLHDNNLEGCLEKHRRIQRVAAVLLPWDSSRFNCPFIFALRYWEQNTAAVRGVDPMGLLAVEFQLAVQLLSMCAPNSEQLNGGSCSPEFGCLSTCKT